MTGSSRWTTPERSLTSSRDTRPAVVVVVTARWPRCEAGERVAHRQPLAVGVQCPRIRALRWSSENGGSRRTRRWAMIHTRHRRRRTPSSGSASATRTRHGPPSGAFTPGSRSARSSPISRRRDASRRPPRRWGKTSAVTMPHLGGLPASRIREVRMQNYRVGPPPWGGGRWRADVPGPALVRRYSSDESSPGCGLGRLGSSPSD